MVHLPNERLIRDEGVERRRAADRMAAFILVLMVAWLFGAAVMLTAAYKGSKIRVASPTAVDNNSPGGNDANAAPSGTAPATQ